jgi:hypothetical protein
VKIWSVDDRSYVETLFGHNDKISAVDAGTRERAVTAGTQIIRVFWAMGRERKPPSLPFFLSQVVE